MPSLIQTKILPYSANDLYQMVMDIEKYPQFLPWCKQAKIVSVISENNLQADLLINFKNFFEKYRSNVHHAKNPNGTYFIDVEAIKGPFKTLINQWKFCDLENGTCEIEFFIEFEFNSIMMTTILGGFFKKAAEKMMAAFEERAQELHKIN